MIMKVEESMIPFESATRPIYSRDGRAFVREGEMYLKNEKNTVDSIADFSVEMTT